MRGGAHNRLHTSFVDPKPYSRSISRFSDERDCYASLMNVEDSYEGAVRRLQRLEMAGVALEAPPPSDDAERMRELEELAMLACEDNERFKREFGVAL